MPLSETNTGRIEDKLKEANEVCGRPLLVEYRIDCLRNYYLDLARSLPNTGDYAPIKTALLDGAARLDAIVEKNIDPGAPTVRPVRKDKPDAPKTAPLRAVTAASLPTALAEAEAVVADTALVILRSGEDPARRAKHYIAISEAVESNLVILRSA